MTKDFRSQPDEVFLRDCRVEVFRGPGPGGQKRNKTSSAVRMTHEPTGLIGIAGELRSQAQNRAMALRRLRLRMVVELRESVDLSGFLPPGWFRIDLSTRSDDYERAVGLILDVLAAADWSTGTAREVLAAGSREFIQFLAREPSVWAHVQRERAARGLRTLTNQ